MPQEFKDNPQFKQGYLYAVRLLAASKKSETELLKRLFEKGYSKESVYGVIENLKDKGILNDHKLVEETVQWAIQAKRYGKRRIFMELKRRGIPTNEIETALKQYPVIKEKEIAFELAHGRWEKFKKLDAEKRKRRTYDFLLNRGFDFELSRELIAELESKGNENF